MGEQYTPAVFEGMLEFTRRRYGRTTYTWVRVFLKGQWQDVGDPWPSVVVPKRDLERIQRGDFTVYPKGA